jgi:1-acyl-sn-glycerol-3-phosphate acyltransferase
LYIKIGFFFYFRRIHIHNIHNVPKDVPLLLLSNHQNALLDALLIATKCGRFSYFLTRAAVFKNPIIAKILRSLQMLPVYRIRDGWGNLSNNNAVFDDCSALLYNKEAVVIFPEGNHNLKRTVRPLSKGFTRIVLDTFEKYPKVDLQLLPVGLNFKKAEHFPDEAAIYFGKPITAKDLISGHKKEDVMRLKTRIQSEISELTTNIPDENYQEILQTLEDLQVDFLKPEAVNACINSNFKECKPIQKQNNDTAFKKVIKTVLICNMLLPYMIWKFIAEPKIKELEFVSTFRFAVSITLVPIWMLIIVLFLGFGIDWYIAMSYLCVSLCLALVYVKS